MKPALLVDASLIGWAALCLALGSLVVALARRPALVSEPPPWLAWIVAPAVVMSAHALGAGQQPLVRMVLIIVPLLWAMKLCVVIAAPAARWVGALAFLLWPGMAPEAFADAARGRPSRGDAGREALWGASFLSLGLVELMAANVAAAHVGAWGANLLSLVGLSLVLHFGLIRLQRAGLLLLGFAPAPLFVAPLLANDLSSFWGRRWNVAFRDMVHRAVFAPLSTSLRAHGGPRGLALAGGFVFSGLLHEAAISLPAGGGYGGPLLYFVVHAGLVLVERRPLISRLLGSSVALGRAWVVAGLLLPLPLLFGPPFLEQIVGPLSALLIGHGS